VLHSASAVLAYIDPGTGSIVLQVVIAGMLTGGVLLRRYLFAPLAWFRGRGAATPADLEQAAESSKAIRP
jgi:hypothetical protein